LDEPLVFPECALETLFHEEKIIGFERLRARDKRRSEIGHCPRYSQETGLGKSSLEHVEETVVLERIWIWLLHRGVDMTWIVCATSALKGLLLVHVGGILDML
jgi:hypothetical protein